MSGQPTVTLGEMPRAIAFALPGVAQSPRHWAMLVVRRIISAEPVSPQHRVDRIERFSQAIADAITPFFRKPDLRQAPAIVRAIRDAFLASEWSALASDEGRQQEVRFIVENTLNEALDPFFSR